VGDGKVEGVQREPSPDVLGSAPDAVAEEHKVELEKAYDRVAEGSQPSSES
jgi:hypothetical protein